MAYTHIAVKAAPAATVTLDRPEVRNAMDDTTLRELSHAFRELARMKDVRAVVVQGEGQDFCAGADIRWMRRAGWMRPADGRKDAKLLADMCRAVDECPVPVIARVHGAIYGGGLGLVSACDVAIAASDAKMCFSEVRLGILPAVVSCFVLPKIGASAARRYYLTAEVFGMARAKEMGLVHEVVPVEELDSIVGALVTSVMRNGPNAVREAKALIRRLEGKPLAPRIRLTVDTLVRLRQSPEGQEGLSAFLEKRPASWVAREPSGT